MRSKGYTSLDIIIVIIVLAISAVITIPKISMAMKDNREELYQNQIKLYLNQAILYGENNKDEFDEDNTIVLTIDDLIDKEYIITSNEDNKIYDIRDNVTELNKMKIRIKYNEDEDKVSSELV